MAFVTFIVPTIGRDSLHHTINSLLAQTDPDWDAVILFDGVAITYNPGDPRIQVYRQDEPTNNCGLARNEAIKYASGEWLAFVDDDDYVLPTYTEKLRRYAPNQDIILFTFRIMNTGVLRPSPGVDKITRGETGISFAVRHAFRKQYDLWFTEGIQDDYRFLYAAEQANARILITHDVQYIVPSIGGLGVWRPNILAPADFGKLTKYYSIIVTGPQRSGTRIVAQMIAQDTGKEYVDEKRLFADSLYKLRTFLGYPTIIQAPALCAYAHVFGQFNDDMAVVLVRRPIEEIIASQARIKWDGEPIERLRYPWLDAPISVIKYAYWDQYQRHRILHPYEVEYQSLSSHPLWIPPEKRKNFKYNQTMIK